MKAKNLLGEKMIDNHKAAIPGMSKLKTDQYYGTYQWSKDVAGHDGKKQTAPKVDNDEFNDTSVVGGLSNTEHQMAKKAAKGKVTTMTAPGSKENKDIQTKSPLTKVKENSMSEARMSSAVKLQRAWEREKAKSDASRKRGEEVMAQAKKDAEKKSKEQGMAKGLNEFAPPGSNDGGDDGFSEETLKRLASQWYNGDEDPRVERTLMAAGWEIGQDEGYDDEPGVFVVQAGDINGNSYISWPAHELKQGMAKGLNEFAPAGGGTPPRGPKTPGRDPWSGGDGPGDDPYSRPEPEYYSRSIDFFGKFEADHFDKEDFDEATGTFKGYWDYDGKLKQIAYFKFDDARQAAKDFNDSPGMGWYYEPVDESKLKEFAPGTGGSGRWYNDSDIAAIVGDGWFEEMDVAGDVPKEWMLKQAQEWLDNQGYSVQVLNCRINDNDMDWFIEGEFDRGIEESAMPASVIKSKQRYAEMTPEEFAKAHADKSDEELKAMAWRHGYGKGSSHYVDKRNKGKQKVTEMDSEGYKGYRDDYKLGGPEGKGKMISPKKAATDAEKMMNKVYNKMMKSMSDKDKVKKGWRNPDVKESDRLGKGMDIIFYVKHADGTRTYANVKNKEQLAQLQQKFKDEETKTLDGNHPEVQAWLEKRRVGPDKLWPGAVVKMYPAAYEPHHSMKGVGEGAFDNYSPIAQQQIVKDKAQSLKNTGASEVIRDLIQGSLDGYDVMVHPRTPAQKVVSKMMQRKYDDIAIDHGLHPDDEFEEIINRIIDSFEEDYGVDESLQQVSEVNPHNYDSDWDYYDALKRAGKKYERDPDDYEPEEPYDPYVEFEREQERRRAKTAHLEPKIEYSNDEGQAPNGKRYNMTVKFTSPDAHRADHAANRWMDLEWGAKKLADKEQHEHNGTTTVTIYVQDNHKHGYWKPWKDEEPISKGISFESIDEDIGYKFDTGPKFLPRDTLGTDMSYHWGHGGGNKYGIDSKLGPREDPRFGKRDDGKQGYRPEYQRPSEYDHGSDRESPRDNRRAELNRLLSMYGRLHTKIAKLQRTNSSGSNDRAIRDLQRQLDGVERSIIDMGGEHFLRHYTESINQSNELKLLEQTFVNKFANKYTRK